MYVDGQVSQGQQTAAATAHFDPRHVLKLTAGALHDLTASLSQEIR
jgi:hypothetical protein